MIWIFGSLHIDPKETVELRRIFSNLKKKNVIIAIELESNKETAAALLKFRDLSDKGINKILEYQFGKRRIIATFRFMKLAAKMKNVTKIVSIEPKDGKKIKALTSDISSSYKRFSSRIKYAKSHKYDENLPLELLKLHFMRQLSQARQCGFREINMANVVAAQAKQNTDSEVLLYCSYAHSAYLKQHLQSKRLKFRDIRGSKTVGLERRLIKLD